MCDCYAAREIRDVNTEMTPSCQRKQLEKNWPHCLQVPSIRLEEKKELWKKKNEQRPKRCQKRKANLHLLGMSAAFSKADTSYPRFLTLTGLLTKIKNISSRLSRVNWKPVKQPCSCQQQVCSITRTLNAGSGRRIGTTLPCWPFSNMGLVTWCTAPKLEGECGVEWIGANRTDMLLCEGGQANSSRLLWSFQIKNHLGKTAGNTTLDFLQAETPGSSGNTRCSLNKP